MPPAPVRRVLGYCRVSTADQGDRGTSLDGQREEIERYCVGQQLPKPSIVVEVESGASAERRVEQLRLVEHVEPGDLVIVAKQDRWSRDTLHFLASIKEIQGRGGRFLSLAERFDPSTPEGVFAATVMASVATLERQRILDRTLGARQRLRRMGLYVEGEAPLGYRVESRKLVPAEPGATTVRRMFELCSEGRSTRQAAAALQVEFPGVVGLDHAAVARRLRDRRYLGELSLKGDGTKRDKRWGTAEWKKGTHEALVDVALWRRAQLAMDGRRAGGRPANGEARNAHFLVRGFARCGHCGRILEAHAAEQKRSITHDGYYQCPGRQGGRCDGPRARRDHVDAEVSRLTLARLEELAEVLSKPIEVRPVQRAKLVDFDAERGRLDAQRARLVEAIAQGVLRDAHARAKMDDLEAKLVELERREAAALTPMSEKPKARMERLGEVKVLREAWGRLGVDRRRDLLMQLAESAELSRTGGRWERGAWRLRLRWV